MNPCPPPEPAGDGRVPCVPGDETVACCLMACIFGARCCPAGDCALCKADRARRRRMGYSQEEVDRRFARERARMLDACPRCGFPPPPPLLTMPEFPRLPREGQADEYECRTCGKALLRGRRRYCNDGCWREHVRRTEMEGRDITSPAPPRTYRVTRQLR